MTCREKFEMDAAGDMTKLMMLDVSCPSDYGYLKDPDYCPCNDDNLHAEKDCENVCRKCWDREIQEDEYKIISVAELARNYVDVTKKLKEYENKENETMKDLKRMTKDELIKNIAEMEDELATSKDNCDILQKELDEAKKNLKKTTQYDKPAEETRLITDAFVNAGYSEDHAVQLTCAMITSAANMMNTKPTINFGGLRL